MLQRFHHYCDSYKARCESDGITRELVEADEQHTELGPIDRKTRIIRITTPKIIDGLDEDNILRDSDANVNPGVIQPITVAVPGAVRHCFVK